MRFLSRQLHFAYVAGYGLQGCGLLSRQEEHIYCRKGHNSIPARPYYIRLAIEVIRVCLRVATQYTM